MSGVGTFILGRPRPLPDDRRASDYTLNCDEPGTLSQEVHQAMCSSEGKAGLDGQSRPALASRPPPAAHSPRPP